MNPFRILKDILEIGEIKRDIKQIKHQLNVKAIDMTNFNTREKNYLGILLDEQYHTHEEMAIKLRISKATSRVYLHRLISKDIKVKTARHGRILMFKVFKRQIKRLLNAN